MEQLFGRELALGCEGADVDDLHIILCALNLGGGLIRDGVYRHTTEKAIARLQFMLCMAITGNFNQTVTAGLKGKMGIDLDAISPGMNGNIPVYPIPGEYKKMWALFPPALESGSRGAAVDALHIILCALGFGREILRDGKYGSFTEVAVADLQRSLGFSQTEINGKFNEPVRTALKDQKNIHINVIPRCVYAPCITYYVEDREEKKWDPEKGLP